MKQLELKLIGITIDWRKLTCGIVDADEGITLGELMKWPELLQDGFNPAMWACVDPDTVDWTGYPT